MTILVLRLYLEPPHVEEELEESEEREEHVRGVATFIHKLAAHQAGDEEHVHCQGHYLQGMTTGIKVILHMLGKLKYGIRYVKGFITQGQRVKSTCV